MKIRTSRAGSEAGDGGFTLLELLVVLAIIGVLAASIPGFLLRGNKTLDIDRAARSIAGGLRSTQMAAIVGNRDRTFGIDVERRQFLAGDAKAPSQLPANIDLHFVTARQERISQSTGRVRFFPDGSSTGGRITLDLEGRTRTVEVDWLTGLVSLSSDPG